MATENNPYLTVTLTGRRPVKIKKDEWPVIASAEESDHDGGEVESQANRNATWRMTVRQHQDGRKHIAPGQRPVRRPDRLALAVHRRDAPE